jgi:hypothetical protein
VPAGVLCELSVIKLQFAETVCNKPRSGAGNQPRVSEAEPWVTNRMDASPEGAKEHGWNSQLLERFFLRPFQGLFLLGRFPRVPPSGSTLG